MGKLLITTATGPDLATRASLPFHIAANGAVASGVDCSIALAGDATGILVPGVMETVKGIGIPPLAELWQKCIDGGVKIHV